MGGHPSMFAIAFFRRLDPGLPHDFRFSPFMIASPGRPLYHDRQDLYGDAVFNTRATVGNCSVGTTA